MLHLDRTNTTLIGRWWWTVDRPTLAGLGIILIAGVILVLAGSPPVAEHIGLDAYYFVRRQFVFLGLAVFIILGLSLQDPSAIRKLALFGLAGCLLMMVIVPFAGAEVKGARRWLYLGSLSVQPSEFMKPCFAVVTAWLFAERFHNPAFRGFGAGMLLYVIVVGLLLAQPDFGMVGVVSLMWGGQLVLAGLPLYWIPILLVAGMTLLYVGYSFLPHVTKRIDRFLDPDSGVGYQVSRSIEAFQHGGWFGAGPGEGIVKRHLPDSHTDFIFAVAGEEFGLIASLLLVTLFAFVVLRGFWRVRKERDLFVLLAVAGLLFQFGLQAMINMGVTMNLLPPKGMTLPFLSYGGSSVLGMAIGMGMLLALTRRRYGLREYYEH